MDENVPVIYGLEFMARALAPQSAETEAVRFFVGTQSIKFTNNQVHLVELNEENGQLNTEVFRHSEGEVWAITTSPSDPKIISTCYNSLIGENTCCMKSSLWSLPQCQELSIDDEARPDLQKLCDFDTSAYGQGVKLTTFHPVDGKKIITIVDNHFIQWDLEDRCGKFVSVTTLEGKNQPKFTTGKWNPHHNCVQFATANDSCVRSWDLRTESQQAWCLENTHCQLVRDFDFNPNKQYFVASCGDDGYSKFWDVRNPNSPLLTRADHSHWVWSIRYNHFHDQLVLTSSSDSRVILTCVASISSEPFNQLCDEEGNENEKKEKLEDGVLATYDEHEDSVYSVEWSTSDPWTFASLSYDGRLVINKVPRTAKYKILL